MLDRSAPNIEPASILPLLKNRARKKGAHLSVKNKDRSLECHIKRKKNALFIASNPTNWRKQDPLDCLFNFILANPAIMQVSSTNKSNRSEPNSL